MPRAMRTSISGFVAMRVHPEPSQRVSPAGPRASASPAASKTADRTAPGRTDGVHTRHVHDTGFESWASISAGTDAGDRWAVSTVRFVSGADAIGRSEGVPRGLPKRHERTSLRSGAQQRIQLPHNSGDGRVPFAGLRGRGAGHHRVHAVHDVCARRQLRGQEPHGRREARARPVEKAGHDEQRVLGLAIGKCLRSSQHLEDDRRE